MMREYIVGVTISLALLVAPWYHSKLDIATNIISFVFKCVENLDKPVYQIKEGQLALINEQRTKFKVLGLFMGVSAKTRKETISTMPAMYIYRPVDKDVNASPVIIFLHGGGFVFGDPKIYEPILSNLCVRTGFTVIGVNYRKSPEFKFPVAIEDSKAAVKYVYTYADELKIDRKNIIVMGDSAGGHISGILATQMSQYLKAAVLVYPIVTFGILSRFTQMYFQHRENVTHKLACMLCNVQNSLKHVPYMHIVTADIDPLKDDGIELFEVLNSSGSSNVTHKHYENTIHGFFGNPYLPHGAIALNDVAQVIKKISLLPNSAV